MPSASSTLGWAASGAAAPDGQDRGSPLVGGDTVRVAILGIFLILSVGALFMGKSLLLPVTLAFLFALVLSPVVRTLRRRGIPEVVTAFLLVVVLGIVLAVGFRTLSGPVSYWIDNAPRIGWELRYKLADLRQSIEEFRKVQEQIREATEQDAEPGTEQVVVREPGLFDEAASSATQFVAGTGLMFVLLLFLLASGDLFHEKLVRSLPTLRDKKQGLRIAYDVERAVSRYLFTITMINIGLGVAVGAGMFALGMPNPLLWGVAAALLNFVPFLGAIAGIVLVAVVALVSFPTPEQAALAPLLYLACNIVESQFVTPTVLGRRLQINAVAVFLAIAFWGWLWGVVGVFIAVPLLIVVKVFAARVEGLGPLNEFLSARHADAGDNDRGSGVPV